ncbi:Uma2 family endonuclease [Methylopila sp. M107]|uniref:Uma2 family endonuclease n=1 Tax=Methylopila sp. M107 TaxID=1101190 RepID=UPI00037357A5|nr:Uma2 family endonuclease [Methylopila sp. M107]
MGEPELKRMTVDEFLVWQQAQDRNYELVDGIPVLPLKAMTGASGAHDTVTVNVLRELSTQLRRKPCRARTDDTAILIKSGSIRRPDVLVDCGPLDLKRTSASAPRLVVEVLSPSTMNYDRVKKLDEYKTVPSLAYILLVDTEKPQLTLHVRHGDIWTPQSYVDLDAVVDLPEIDCRIAARDIFEGLPFAE